LSGREFLKRENKTKKVGAQDFLPTINPRTIPTRRANGISDMYDLVGSG